VVHRAVLYVCDVDSMLAVAVYKRANRAQRNTKHLCALLHALFVCRL
jgi:hypothetical protein